MKGKKEMTDGSTEFSAHVATEHHEKSELEGSILMTEENWFKRGVKEAIAIRKLKPSLNQDDGRYHLSPMYNELIRDHVTLQVPRKRTEDATVQHN